MAIIVILVGGMILSKLELEFEGSQFRRYQTGLTGFSGLLFFYVSYFPDESEKHQSRLCREEKS